MQRPWRRFSIVAAATAGLAVAAPSIVSGQATGPPVATTGSAGAVGPGAATLSGTVNPEGLATTYRFEYGTSRSYGSKTPSSSVPAGTEPVAVEARLDGLRPASGYHYRLIATSSAGTSAGADRILRTPDLKLDGTYRVRTVVLAGGRPFGQRRGQRASRNYRIRARCDRTACGKLKLRRQGRSGTFKSTLRRRGPGSWQGSERFRGHCDNGLRFRTRATISLRARGGSVKPRASALKGSISTRASGCVKGRERVGLRGKARG